MYKVHVDKQNDIRDYYIGNKNLHKQLYRESERKK